MTPRDSGKKLKIGMVCYPSVGGSGIVATALGSWLADLGHEVHFISYDPPFHLNIRQKNVFFHRVRFKEYELFKYPDYTLPLAVKMVDIAQKYKLDIMHVHYAVPHATAALLAKQIALVEKMHFPNVVTTLHGTDITLLAGDKTLAPVIKYSIESSCGVTAVSESLRKSTMKILDKKKPIRVIHNFYDPKEITEERSAIRKSLKVGEKDLLIIHMSNVRAVKDIPTLLRIIAKVKKDRDGSRIKLLILSGGDFGQYEPLVKKLGIKDRVIVKKDVRHIQNYIHAADMGLYTSLEESFGMGILETMSYGRLVLATRVGGIPEFMQHGKTGFLFKKGDIDAFAGKILELANDSETTVKLGNNAGERAQNSFSGKEIVAQYIAYYREIIRTCR